MISAKVQNRRVSGAARAARNLANHDFSLPILSLASNERAAKANQRGAKDRIVSSGQPPKVANWKASADIGDVDALSGSDPLSDCGADSWSLQVVSVKHLLSRSSSMACRELLPELEEEDDFGKCSRA